MAKTIMLAKAILPICSQGEYVAPFGLLDIWMSFYMGLEQLGVERLRELGGRV